MTYGNFLPDFNNKVIQILLFLIFNFHKIKQLSQSQKNKIFNINVQIIKIIYLTIVTNHNKFMNTKEIRIKEKFKISIRNYKMINYQIIIFLKTMNQDIQKEIVYILFDIG